MSLQDAVVATIAASKVMPVATSGTCPFSQTEYRSSIPGILAAPNAGREIWRALREHSLVEAHAVTVWRQNFNCAGYRAWAIEKAMLATQPSRLGLGGLSIANPNTGWIDAFEQWREFIHTLDHDSLRLQSCTGER